MTVQRFVRILITGILLAGCQHQSPPSLSFYYWKTSFHINDYEKKLLLENAVHKLYVRYFDVDIPDGETEPRPVSPVTFDTTVQSYEVVPVVFIKNRTFEKPDSAAIENLAINIQKLVNRINQSQQINIKEIQFDCDWTETTQQPYFLFLQRYKALTHLGISSTIRLHQVKYRSRTGVPPVDYGILMYYNMGTINAGKQNSIYEASIANRYNSYIRGYPLTLDVALPIFSWGQKVRDGQVVELLNKIYYSHFKNDSNFIAIGENRFITKHACFKAGYYFREKDEVKIERVPGKSLLEIIEQVNRYSDRTTRQLVFYDLDSLNFIQYEKGIFKKILGRTH